MENKPVFHPDPDAKLMDQVREVLRYHHYTFKTEKIYCHCKSKGSELLIMGISPASTK